MELKSQTIAGPEEGKTAEERREPEAYGDCFPNEFEFYGMGRVAAASGACELTELAPSPFVVTFRVSGEERGLCAVALNHRPGDGEISMLIELANILASKLITQLADRDCASIMISPPSVACDGEPRHQYLKSTLLAGGTQGSLARRYEFEGMPGLVLRLAYLPTIIGGNT